jgi:hypothetical protein
VQPAESHRFNLLERKLPDSQIWLGNAKANKAKKYKTDGIYRFFMDEKD